MAVGSRLRHVVESQQFSRALLEELFVRSEEMKREPHHFIGRLAGQVMAALFYEPSTRTRLSFEAAMLRLGGTTMGTANARRFSYLANGRTVRSLTYLLSKFKDIKLWFVAPPQVAMGDDLKAHLDEHHVPWVETEDLNAVLPDVDVVYMTRIQKERFTDPEAYNAVKGVYRMDKASMTLMRKYAILMHPLPRVDEIAPEVDEDPRAAYFRQARNGLHIRMALLDKILS